MSISNLQAALAEHLAWWGLKRFESDAAYFQWQRESLGRDDLAGLHRLVTDKQAPGAGSAAEIAFYDRAAAPRILPVLYSQRYDYYLAVGPLVAERIAKAASDGLSIRSVLDLGCGVGVLTTFFAKQFPSMAFTGLDRSRASLVVAREKAAALGLKNVRFEEHDLEAGPAGMTGDLIVATQTLLQSEQHPGLPSQGWETFVRARDNEAQTRFEASTAVGPKLDHLVQSLSPDGWVFLFEKARQLARRIPLQRALAARGLGLVDVPLPVRYQVVEEVSEDGPFYVLGRRQAGRGKQEPRWLEWDEAPEPIVEPDAWNGDVAALLRDRTHDQDEQTPLYENHSPAAQDIWAGLPGKQVSQQKTWGEPAGTQMHVELGTFQELTYLYQANAFDQRQIVLVESQRSGLLEDYYRELTGPPAEEGPNQLSGASR